MRLLLDENVSRPVAAALVARGADAVHAVDVGLAGASDVAVFEWAVREARVIVTRDYRDFAQLARVASRGGRHFPGVLFLSPALRQGDVGGIAAALERVVRRGAGFEGGVGWVPGTTEPEGAASGT